jgi:nucleoid-associated protein YgaU
MVHAQIINLDDTGAPAIECMFNPTSYTLAKSNVWLASETKGSNIPPLEFSSGSPATLTMQLFFDTYRTAQKGVADDVRKAYTGKILNLMLVDEKLKDAKNNKSRPPRVRFQWGKAWLFNAVITSVSQQFTLFLGNGTPVRATLDVTFQQVEDAVQGQSDRPFPGTNPTSGGTGGERVWTVTEGDTLAWIAYKEYGDATLWRPIAACNRLTQVRRLRPGMLLEIPNA